MTLVQIARWVSGDVLDQLIDGDLESRLAFVGSSLYFSPDTGDLFKVGAGFAVGADFTQETGIGRDLDLVVASSMSNGGRGF